MKLRKLGVVLLGLALIQGTVLGAEDKEYTLSETVQQLMVSEKQVKSDPSKMTFPDIKFFLNGKEVKLNKPVMSVGGKTFLPLRALGEALGMEIGRAHV